MCLYSGEIFNNTAKKYLECKIKVLEKHSIDEILKVQAKNYKFIRDKSLYVPITHEELDEIFSGKGYVLGVFVTGKLVAFRILSFHDAETIKLAKKAGLDDSRRVIFFESTLVDYNYIGNGLQKKMINLSLEKIIDRNLFEYGISTVSPKNIPSIKSLLKTGFYIKNNVAMYGGKARFICIINLASSNQDDIVHKATGHIYDFERQVEFFNLGYKIVDIEKDTYIFSK
ncbi:MAG: hypothetical protein WBA54_09920 [Acidaminobacteraceae bacterium]